MTITPTETGNPHLDLTDSNSVMRLLESLPSQRLEDLNQLILNNLDLLPSTAWGRIFMSHYLPLPYSPLQTYLLNWFDQAPKSSKLCLIAPRGGAKSTCALIATLHLAVHGAEPYIQLISETSTQAEKQLQCLRVELEENDLLAQMYPHAVGEGPIWRRDALQLRTGTLVEALGTGSSARGRRHGAARPSLIILDDPQGESHISSPTLRETTLRWLMRAMLNSGTPSTRILAIGTALHREAAVCQLQHAAGFASKTFRALDPMPTNLSLWADWQDIFCGWENPNREEEARQFYEARKEQMDEGAKPLWPELEDTYTLMAHRALVGIAAFESEKQGNPVSGEQCEWDDSYFDHIQYFTEWPKDLIFRCLTLDPSKGADSKTSDRSAYCMLGVTKDLMLYVDIDAKRRAVPEMVAQGIDHFLHFRPDYWGVEGNSFQDLLLPEFERGFQDRKLFLPNIQLINNQVNKNVRIRRVGHYLSRRQIRLKKHSPGVAILLDELRAFPNSEFDDSADSLEMAIRQAVANYNAVSMGQPF
jgi:hypothetical protein